MDSFQQAATQSLTWLENVELHLALEPVPFTYKLMTRSRRVGYARLLAQAPEFVARYDEWRTQQPPAPGPIPAEFLDLFDKATFAHLATLMPDGTPHVTPVWVDYDGRHILVNSAAGRQKDLNMAATSPSRSRTRTIRTATSMSVAPSWRSRKQGPRSTCTGWPGAT